MSASTNSDLAESHEEHTTTETKKWYRSSMFNACVIGMVGFMAPGLWNAMNSLGAGGAQKPFLVNAANALVFGLMGFFCLFGGPIANRIGLKWTLVLGAVGYPVYSAGLYTNNRYVGSYPYSQYYQLGLTDLVGQRLVCSSRCSCMRCFRWSFLGFRRSRCSGLSAARQAWPIHEHLACFQNRRTYLGRCHPSWPQPVCR